MQEIEVNYNIDLIKSLLFETHPTLTRSFLFFLGSRQTNGLLFKRAFAVHSAVHYFKDNLGHAAFGRVEEQCMASSFQSFSDFNCN